MNKKLDEICSAPIPALPLTDAGSIIVGNALRLDWLDVCPPQGHDEIYIVGNPPYLGSNLQNDEQKEDLRIVFESHSKSYKKLDYIACWYAKAAEYSCTTNAQAAFVATNSICQGEQVCILWPIIFSYGQEISFAHTSFKWQNNAAKNAAVICIIVGIRKSSAEIKKIFNEERSCSASNINPYLANAPNVIVFPRSSAVSLPPMSFGNQFLDGGNLIFSEDEKRELIANEPASSIFFRQVLGSKELIQGDVRHCLWITNENLALAESIGPIRQRLERVREFRGKSSREGTKQFTNVPHLFPLASSPPQHALVIPRVSSERRPYIPVGFATDQHLVPDSAFTVLKAPTWLFSIVGSKLHNVWTSAVGGRLKSDFRYSNTLVYNTFPLPKLSNDQQVILEDHALHVLRIREPHISEGRNLAWLYNPETMPSDLLQAHRDLDDYLETIYIGRPFKDDAERLEHLFKLYARMTKTAAKAA